MAIILPNGFQITSIEPVDSRFTVADEAARLSFSRANVYEGLTVYQQSTDELYILTDVNLHDSAAGWRNIIKDIDTGSFAVTASNIFRGDQTVTGSIWLTGNISASSGLFFDDVVINNGKLEIVTDDEDVFLIKNVRGGNLFYVSQSGIAVFAVHETDPGGDAPIGGVYFTSTSFFVGLE